MIDFSRFHSDSVAEAIARASAEIGRAFHDRVIVGPFYGYTLEHAWSATGPQQQAHLALGGVLRSPDVTGGVCSASRARPPNSARSEDRASRSARRKVPSPSNAGRASRGCSRSFVHRTLRIERRKTGLPQGGGASNQSPPMEGRGWTLRSTLRVACLAPLGCRDRHSESPLLSPSDIPPGCLGCRKGLVSLLIKS